MCQEYNYLVYFFLIPGFIEVAFTQSLYTVPNASLNGSCVREDHSLPLPPSIQLQLNKPTSVVVTINVTVKEEDTICELCNFVL